LKIGGLFTRYDFDEINRMTKNKDIEQLFREGFETFEEMPSKKVWRGVRYGLLKRDFLHFEPRSFNAWYAGGGLIIGVVLGFMMLGGEEKAEVEVEDKVEVEVEGDSGIMKDLGRKDYQVSEIGLGEDHKTNSKPEEKTSVVGNKSGKVAATDKKLNREENRGVTANLIKETEDNKKLVSEELSGQAENYNSSGVSVLAWFKASSPGGCVPLAINFTNYSQNAVRYSWSFGDGGSSELVNPSYIFDEPGTWFVSLTAYGANNEISIYSDTIQVHPKPEARFSMDVQSGTGDDLPVYFYNYSRGAENYLWDFGDGSSSTLKDPDHYFSKKSQISIKLLAISAEGCADSALLKDAFKEGEPVFIFPTAFSPSPSGPGTGQYSKKSPENDIFYPHVIEQPEEYQLRIFNRSGALLFESNDIHIGWDGYYHEELVPQGVYVWKARARFGDGRSVVRVGDVTVLSGETHLR
jgi:gliding motility-associated-like protein